MTLQLDRAAAARDVPAAAIEAHGIQRTFGTTNALRGVDLSVATGEIYGFLGPNGAGKTTLVRILTTLLRPSSGTARVAGADVVRDAETVRLLIGVALQEAALDPGQTGRELLHLQAALFAIPRSISGPRVTSLIELVDLGDAIDRRVSTYSGGMKRRLDLALALVHKPRILFLDEPTTGLDPSSRADMWREVSHLARDEGVTVFLTTQYLEEADVLADRIAIIDHGNIVARGTPEELKAEIGRPTLEVTPADRDDRRTVEAVLARFGSAAPAPPESAAVRLSGGAEALAAVVRALDAEDVAMRDFQLHAPTLDDVFLAKTGRKLDAGDEEGTGEHAEAVPA